MYDMDSVYAFGRGDLGQLGVGDEREHTSPTSVTSLVHKDIVHIAAGDYHTAFLTGTFLSLPLDQTWFVVGVWGPLIFPVQLLHCGRCLRRTL